MKKTALLSLLIGTFLVASGCSPGPVTQGAGGSLASAASGVKTVVVGTGTSFPNICFIDENGKLTGYDVELIREIDRRLPDYEFELKTFEFKNLLLSLETSKIDLIAHQMEVNEERKAKFLFNDEAYNIFPNKVVVRQDNNEVRSIEDLKGKKLIVTATSNAAVLAEKWNKEHGNPINIVYTGTGEDANAQIKSGRVDATISTQFAIDFLNKSVDAQLKTVGEPLSNSKVYYILRKDATELKQRIDEALREIKADGTLAKLSTEWLGGDYTVEQ
ncbi:MULTISPECIES: amino acid ABC transporter substrate-binding protein [Brevibacillus]|jgi:L-cystine transport system substrate-binding protein|uniref:Family 3 extracellular solute-binding protein n=1 Tax=Brevibacillus borstelensis AK1 TaxID=1300222 RepID=M8DIX1_9BACL|nr:amino acid ABC transporter substrate-binding protein [Brevibacillus borstelensis]EMT53382.1 family 3 extracellular solute-binding protein [Brevibacillus borstelensis AK1]KKX53219.1 L-cystine-binding protein TcyJ [Brevibacillus borstelensis cifa_chp40]MBE5394240.1 amino acid ABC transporter substrate-binding protein [Brevibacillus borstelensis]MCC0564246.1 amino acid ABC transporter substrate-binding protein [Brevibacillus borstelensis]MCM3471561.1 amino acid ABC transporter substrate-bindin